jgi:GNAT superfamily N-acetyltransferase
MPTTIDSFLPGTFSVSRGTIKDFARLERFHYRRKRPATWAGIWVIIYSQAQSEISNLKSALPNSAPRPVAVAVLSYPCLNSAARDVALNLHALPARDRIDFLNANLRTISRVIVHPQFRSLGLAVRLVRHLCQTCPTRWVEAHAAMGKVHPLFEKAGMRRFDHGPDHPAYYLLDRANPPPP